MAIDNEEDFVGMTRNEVLEAAQALNQEFDEDDEDSKTLSDYIKAMEEGQQELEKEAEYFKLFSEKTEEIDLADALCQETDENRPAMNILINVLKRKLYEKFPSASISVVHEDGEYFFSVNNRQLYYSDYFQLFAMNLKMDILWPKKVYNIFFTLE